MIQINDNDLPIVVAEKIITAQKQYKHNSMQKAMYKSITGGDELRDTCDMFSDDEIEEIAIYLMTYCNKRKSGGEHDS